MQNVLKNKYVLYAVSALAVLNVLGYLSIGSMECLGVFALTALVCQQYNKNMTVCLLAAIFDFQTQVPRKSHGRNPGFGLA